MRPDVGHDLDLRQPLVLAADLVTRTQVLLGQDQGGPTEVVQRVHQGVVDGDRRLQLALVPRGRHGPLPVGRHLQLDRARLADLLLRQS